jgi:hypothetical protein
MRHASAMPVRQPHVFLRAWVVVLFGTAILGLGNGCRKPADNGVLPVSGQVRLNGQPLGDASITFHSDRDQIPGYIDANGRYELKPGAVAGEYRVVIGKYEGNLQAMGLDPGAVGMGGGPSGPSEPPKQVVPARYSDPKQTELRFTVAPPGTKRADFDLVSNK